MGLYQKHRPASLDDLLGQKAAVKAVKGLLDKGYPHASLYAGASGCGKTTTARCVATALGCPPSAGFDYREVNCGSVEKPLETIREIEHAMWMSPVAARCRVWVLDEFQSFSRASFSQQAMLKLLEDTPEHVYFFLCTTDPSKILETIRNRCTRINFAPLKEDEILALLKKVSAAEKFDLEPRLAQKIAQASAGSPRAALVELEKAMGIAEPAERMAAVAGPEDDKGAIDLARELLPFQGDPSWPAVAKCLEAVEGEEPEGIRQVVLAYARKVLLKHGPKPIGLRAHKVIDCLSAPLHEKNSGHALLVSGCFLAVFGNSR